MKRVLTFVLCVMLLCSAALAEPVYNAPGEYPIANEVITLKILAPQDGEYSRAENLQTLELEEKLGIKIEWEIAPSGSMQDKLSTLKSASNPSSRRRAKIPTWCCSSTSSTPSWGPAALPGAWMPPIC